MKYNRYTICITQNGFDYLIEDLFCNGFRFTIVFIISKSPTIKMERERDDECDCDP